ncbi:jg16509 [Pararge aegeria aegeria]|uniref:Jg16509 protein n=1 Tax=Pararge aegeria aegeria TaxID=348720 RepID=A0A8S4S5J3_9NEOP|nr:jg16509 [Pararge aegeria aegeria]
MKLAQKPEAKAAEMGIIFQMPLASGIINCIPGYVATRARGHAAVIARFVGRAMSVEMIYVCKPACAVATLATTGNFVQFHGQCIHKHSREVGRIRANANVFTAVR